MGTAGQDLGARISQVRRSKGIKASAMAEKLGVHRSTMTKIEQGKRSVDGFELVTIAEILETTPRELLGMVPRRQALAVARRLSGSADDTGHAMQRARAILETDGLLDELGEPDSFVGSDLSAEANPHDSPHILARWVRRRLHLGEAPIGNIEAALTQGAGLDVCFEHLGANGLSGLLVHGDGVALVMVNADDIKARQRFTLAHELGHHLMNIETEVVIDSGGPRDTTAEINADDFAAEFLMPATSIARMDESVTRDPTEFVEAMLEFGVSRKAMANRLRDCDLIDDERLAELLSADVREMFVRAGRATALDLLEDSRASAGPPPRIARRAINAYSRGRIGIGPVAALLGKSVEATAAELRNVAVVDTSTVVPVAADAI